MDYEKAYKDLMRDIDIAIKGQNDGETKVVLQNIKERNIETEDEKVRKEIIDFLTDGIWNSIIIDKVRQTQRYAKWIAYLERSKKPFIVRDTGCSKMFTKKPEYCLDVKPAWWGEEDEQFLLVCKNALQKYQSSDKWDAAIICSWLEKRLKFLYPQPHWKPSEEQMRALENCVYGWQDSADGVLKSLYNDLKKLL